MPEDKTFRRIQYNYRGPLKLRTSKLSELTANFGPHDILVKVKAAAFNPVDLMLYNSSPLLFFKRNIKGIGRDFSGVVERVGTAVNEVSVGDRIAGMFEETFTEQGTFSEYLLYNTEKSGHNFGKIPDSMSFVEAASFPLVFGTAFTTLTHHKVPGPGGRVLIYGGGTSVGAYVIQLLKNHHNTGFVASVNSGNSSERVRSYGADAIIDYKTQNVAEEVVKMVNESGKKFDLIIDTVGNKVLFPVIKRVLKPKTEDSGYVTIAGDKVGDYNATLLSTFSFSMLMRILLPTPYNYTFSSISTNWFDLYITLFEEGKIKPTIDSVQELEDFKEAISSIIHHNAAGKVVFKINGGDGSN